MSEASAEYCVWVCQYRSCQQQGSAEVLTAFTATAPANVQVLPSDCMGQCSTSVTVRVTPDNIWYCRVQAKQVPLIVQQHLCNHQPVIEMLHPRLHPRSLHLRPQPNAPETPPHARE